MTDGDIIDITRDYVLELFFSKSPNDICFHNVKHTQEVVQATIEIAEQCHFTQKQLEIVMLAAWFHDCGYTITFTNHEDSSKTITADFLNRHNYPKEDIEQVLACIEATRFPQNPTSPEEEVWRMQTCIISQNLITSSKHSN